MPPSRGRGDETSAVKAVPDCFDRFLLQRRTSPPPEAPDLKAFAYRPPKLAMLRESDMKHLIAPLMVIIAPAVVIALSVIGASHWLR